MKQYSLRKRIKADGFPIEVEGVMMDENVYAKMLTRAFRSCFKGNTGLTIVGEGGVEYDPSKLSAYEAMVREGELAPRHALANQLGKSKTDYDYVSLDADGNLEISFPADSLLSVFEDLDEAVIAPTPIQMWLRTQLPGVEFVINKIERGSDDTVIAMGEVTRIPFKAVQRAIRSMLINQKAFALGYRKGLRNR